MRRLPLDIRASATGAYVGCAPLAEALSCSSTPVWVECISSTLAGFASSSGDCNVAKPSFPEIGYTSRFRARHCLSDLLGPHEDRSEAYGLRLDNTPSVARHMARCLPRGGSRSLSSLAMKALALAVAALACAGPAMAMHYTLADPVSLNIEDRTTEVPAFPGDLVTCEEDDAPGEDCNCIDGDEDECTPVAWISCGSDMDCETRARSPYGWKPRRN